MLMEDFRRIVTSFADNKADIDLARGTLLVQIREDLIEARLYQHAGELVVEEGGERFPAARWIINRVARIPLLAERILSYVPRPENFVIPSGRLLDQPDFADSSDDVPRSDATVCALEVLGRRPAGTASVLYLTSDAGEGKTTLINHLSHKQALDYKEKKTDWLLVPIPLGGRTLLRFDDVVIAALVNRLRFQLLYFEAFLELVRLGVLVPAFDGFEEMIIETSPGEAISALGNLMRTLRSAGSVLVAARKAYFDYRSFRTQARLFDAIGKDSASFARLSLNRWSRDQFIDYATKRRLAHPDRLYAAVADRLVMDHPLLTRAVLVRRLVDVAQTLPDISALLDEIGYHPQDYFFQFVNAIVEREALDKWLDQSGEPRKPLLTVEEHHELLAMVAQESWLSSTDALRTEVVGAIADMFAEAKSKPPAIARQVRERLKQHSLLTTTSASGGALAFDHEDFRVFYLGEALGRALAQDNLSDLRSLLQVATLPAGAVAEATLYLSRIRALLPPVVQRIQELATSELPTSFVRENCGAIAVAILDDATLGEVSLTSMNFPADVLRGRQLRQVHIKDSYFQPTALERCRLERCRFLNCRFERLEIGRDAAIDAVLQDCEIGSLLRSDHDDQLYDPRLIKSSLASYGFAIVETEQPALPLDVREPDEDSRLLERVLRIFLRSNQVNESVIRMRLGVRANYFLESQLSDLLRTGVLEIIPYRGSGEQRRFKLGVEMHRIQEALARSGGDFAAFLRSIERREQG